MNQGIRAMAIGRVVDGREMRNRHELDASIRRLD